MVVFVLFCLVGAHLAVLRPHSWPCIQGYSRWGTGHHPMWCWASDQGRLHEKASAFPAILPFGTQELLF